MGDFLWPEPALGEGCLTPASGSGPFSTLPTQGHLFSHRVPVGLACIFHFLLL